MAERSTRPAVPARGWRSSPGVVRLAAVLLGLFGLLLVLVEADQGDLDAAELVTALVLVSAAVALVWAGRLGYWVGLTVAALVAVLLLVVVAAARRPGPATCSTTNSRSDAAARRWPPCPSAGSACATPMRWMWPLARTTC